MTKTIGIVADNWKVDSFKDNLTKNGFTDFEVFPFTRDVSTIKVKAKESDITKLSQLIRLVEMNLKRSN